VNPRTVTILRGLSHWKTMFRNLQSLSTYGH
jgi:hypothetical protein